MMVTEELRTIARQLLEGELMLGGGFLPARRNPLAGPAVAASAPAAAVPVPAATQSPVAPAPAAMGRRVDLPPVEDLPQNLSPTDKAAALDAMREQAVACRGCPLGQSRMNLVFGEGDPNAELVFVGEAPGADEDASGRPFVGRAGQKLTDMIAAMGLRRDQVYICNVLKCRPPGNRTPQPAEVVQCWPFLVRQLAVIRPKVIVTLGNPATQTLLNTSIGITKLRGQWQSLPDIAPGLGGTPVMPTFHPSYILRSYTPEVRGMVWSDLKQVMERLGLKRK
ncbi:MAG: uracil-DNA glycosylase [Phycisphaerae bacterium]|nr:uracil-DNA glycosylase [Phycisphaerae bacterium]